MFLRWLSGSVADYVLQNCPRWVFSDIAFVRHRYYRLWLIRLVLAHGIKRATIKGLRNYKLRYWVWYQKLWLLLLVQPLPLQTWVARGSPASRGFDTEGKCRLRLVMFMSHLHYRPICILGSEEGRHAAAGGIQAEASAGRQLMIAVDGWVCRLVKRFSKSCATR
jgi:hypothetical protein